MPQAGLKEGDNIVINMERTGSDEWYSKDAAVTSLLSVQFTARWLDGTDTISFLFYNDKGVTWRMDDE